MLLAILVVVGLAPAASALGGARLDLRLDGGAAVEVRVDAPALHVPLPDVGALAASLPDAGATLGSAPVAGDVPPALALPVSDRRTGEAAASAPAGSAPAPSAAATVGGLALAWLLLEKLGAARALVALYFRVQPGELLEHERRERVLTLVRERPGIGPSEIAQDLGTAWGVTSYHLDRLERAGLVASQRVGHHRCYFLPGAVPREQQRTVGLFRADTTRRVAELVARRPGIGQSQLCSELGLSASAASKQLARLVATGLVRREGDRSGMRLYPEPSLVAAV